MFMFLEGLIVSKAHFKLQNQNTYVSNKWQVSVLLAYLMNIYAATLRKMFLWMKSVSKLSS
jgi:hypothetical protein